MPARRTIAPILAALIVLCVLGATYLDYPWAALIGWAGAIVCAAMWLILAVRPRERSGDSTLTTASTVSVVCTVSVLLYCIPQLVVSGMIEPGPLVEVMVVFPVIIGMVSVLIGSVSGAVVLARSIRDRQYAVLAMALGHITTCVLAGAIIVWAVNFGTSGWELLFLPLSLIVGQPIVAGGLIARIRATRRTG